MRLTSLLSQFEELEEALSPAPFNDAIKARHNSSLQGHFEEHFIAANHLSSVPIT
jgi:hypothetical protein